MPMVNPFDVFTTSEIADAIQVIPNRYGRLNELNLMPAKGVTQSKISVEEWNGTLALLPTTSRGGPGVVGRASRRKLRTFEVPQIIYEEYVSPEDVHAVRAFGDNATDNLGRLLNERLSAARQKHDITLEHLRMGALKGQILDADGSVIYDLHSEFGAGAIKAVDFVLGTGTTDVRAKCYEVLRHIEDHLLGETSTGAHALVSAVFFDKLIQHPKVKEAYANYQEASQRLGGDVRKGFTFGGITFEEYRARSVKPDGSLVKFVADGDGHAFPLGTVDTFKTYVAPADFNETVGQLGQQYYAKVIESKFGRGYDVHTQQNVLPMCLRPRVLVRIHTSN